jgi:hypothetical protein
MRNKFFLVTFFLSSVVFLSCQNEQEQPKPKGTLDAPLLQLLDSKSTGIDFINTSTELMDRHIGFYDYFYNGSGVAIGDLNNDGLQDIFFAGNDAPNKLYINEGGFKFKDISSSANIESNTWATGVTLVDINSDGFLDIYVCSSGPNSIDGSLANKLYINNGDLTFSEQSASYGIADASYSSQAVFFDIDADNDLDLFVLNHSVYNFGAGSFKWEKAMREQSPEEYKRSCSTLFRNNGDQTFTDISKEAGVHLPGFGLGVAVSDFNGDGKQDIYIANDYFMPDFLFHNKGDGTFVEQIKGNFSHSSFYSMGCDAADFNNDGLVDLVVADMTPADHFRSKTLMPSMDVNFFNYLKEERNYIPQYMANNLSLNRGAGIYSDIASMSGVANTDWSWATLFCDLDNDSNKDLLITNGFKRDTRNQDWSNTLKQRLKDEGRKPEVYFDQLLKASSIPVTNFIFKNDGNLQFRDVSKDWGFTDPSFSNGAAYGDLDNDGDLDVVVNNLEKEAFVYENTASEKLNNNYLQVVLKDGNNAAKVLNSKLKLYNKEQVQLVEYNFVRGYLSNMQEIAHFGLGTSTAIDSLEITWPDGMVTTLKNPKINTKLSIKRNEQKAIAQRGITSTSLFKPVAGSFSKLDFEHKENKFNDFETEILLPHKQSTLGPALAVGDVNGDGQEDFYIGGGKNQAGRLYLQNEGAFTAIMSPFNKDAKYEDLGAHFFDMDGDGDLDLYVASGGGGDIAADITLTQDRLYENMGDGAFKKTWLMLPEIKSSTMAIASWDWDGDGDEDLLIAGRNSPGKYPVAPRSYLLENKNGVFVDVTKKLAPNLENVGMVTSVALSDINSDGKKDILIAGEWMGITCYQATSTGFVDASSSLGLDNTVGWWYSISTADFDNDGDDDVIVGNIGKNNKFHPSKNNPLHIFSNDFDDNGTLDIVLSKNYKGKLAPVRGKECSTQQMPFLENKFPMYSDFAASTLEQIYGVENLQSALHYSATTFKSVYLENMGAAGFKMHELPMEAQMGPVNGIVVLDFDKDGYLDIIIGGNTSNTEAETIAYDASKGLLLKGSGNGTFKPIVNIEESGVFLNFDCKNLALIWLTSQKVPSVLVANNDGPIQLIALVQ